MKIEGVCAPGFERVREEFERSFAARGEVGASVCVTVGGETVVDLWGGTARVDTSAPWQRDTVGVVYSCTKGATALCAHILASRGLLDLDAPVVRYWPGFGKAGKEDIPVRMLLNHQSGLAAISKPLPRGAFYDWELMISAIEEQEPFWKPGTRHGYHLVTFGWPIGEVIRRVSGKSLGAFFRDEVAAPLGLDFWIGLPAEIEPRVAPMIPADPPDPGGPIPPLFLLAASPGSLQAMAFGNMGGYMDPGEVDSRAAHAAEIGAAGGITNARGLAGMYAPLACGGGLRGVELVSGEHLVRMSAVSSAGGEDAMLGAPTRFSLGFMKGVDNRRQPPGNQDSVILSEEAFGHAGAGGSIGFADPKARMSFGYTMNRMGPGILLNERGQSLVDAAYLSLGYRSSAAGSWV